MPWCEPSSTQCAAVMIRSRPGLSTTLAVQKCSAVRLPEASVRNSAPTVGVPVKGGPTSGLDGVSGAFAGLALAPVSFLGDRVLPTLGTRPTTAKVIRASSASNDTEGVSTEVGL